MPGSDIIREAIKASWTIEQATEEAKLGTVKNEQAVDNAVSELTELIMGVLNTFNLNGETEEVSHEELTE